VHWFDAMDLWQVVIDGFEQNEIIRMLDKLFDVALLTSDEI
jgi:hypothetical protein